MAAEDVDPISSYQRNDMSQKARRARQLAEAAPHPRRTQVPDASGDRAAFRRFVQARQPAAKPTAPQKPLTPTEERMEKPDRPRKTQAGFYRAPPPIERLRDRGSLDPQAQINEAMYQASNKLLLHFHDAGLNGIKAQDLSRGVIGSGDGGSCNYPKTERAMHHRQKFREACKLMGWFETHPYKGAGRLVVDVICYEMALKDAAFIHIPSGGNEARLATGMDRLRQGLFTLALHWKLF